MMQTRLLSTIQETLRRPAVILAILLFSFFTSCILGGCVSVSQRAPFNAQVGSLQHTLRPCLIVSIPETDRKFGATHDLMDPSPSTDSQTGNWLPVGTEIRLLTVKRYLLDESGPRTAAIGLVHIPSRGDVKFIYHWGSGSIIRRAPWESENTPAQRKLDSFPLF